jgi:hypothetical protein
MRIAASMRTRYRTSHDTKATREKLKNNSPYEGRWSIFGESKTTKQNYEALSRRSANRTLRGWRLIRPNSLTILRPLRERSCGAGGGWASRQLRRLLSSSQTVLIEEILTKILSYMEPTMRANISSSVWAVVADVQRLRLFGAGLATLGLFLFDPAVAQQRGMQPGEAFLTRFSGVTTTPGPAGQPPTASINVNGAVGSIIDVRAPAFPPVGLHWMTEPQRNAVTAREVGQVFGVVLDEASPPNIYVSATSAFGLHFAPGGTQWMPGLWGSGGGPGTIYRLDASNNYRPRVFANIALNNRANTGAALGNMAFDRTNKQIFVSDLETGMIHRIRAADGTDLGVYDHGTQGRAQFLNVATKQQAKLAPIPFNSTSRAKLTDCPTSFERSPDCWNLAPSGRRVWGVGVRRDPTADQVRLFYAVWSGPGFGAATWSALPEDEKRNSVWSVRIAPDGSIDASDVRREFLLPDFFMQKEDVVRAGYSAPVSDITFSESNQRPILLIAERGPVRNLGLTADEPFAEPHAARALRYELDQSGSWQPVGRYDVGFYDRKNEGQPYIHANSSGGIAFGLGYTDDFSSVDRTKSDQFVWITGDDLCSAEGPCRLPAGMEGDTQQLDGDPSEVHGAQGLPENAIDVLLPPAAVATYPASGEAYPSVGPQLSYMIDADINVDQSGAAIAAEFSRSDTTKIGDIAVYQIPTPPSGPLLLLPPPPPPGTLIAGHDAVLTHAVVASHGAVPSHYWIASHNPWASHSPGHSHSLWSSHDPVVSSGGHFPPGSFGHFPPGSLVHLPPGSPIHLPPGSAPHLPPGSIVHLPIPSGVHLPIPSTIHLPGPSAVHLPIPSGIHLPGPSSVHLPIPSAVHLPIPSGIHLPGPSGAHLPGPSAIHMPVPSAIHLPAPSAIHLPGPSAIHMPIPSGIHLPGPSGAHLPGPSAVHMPVPSALHLPGPSAAHLPAPSAIHLPVISSSHSPPGSAIHVPPGSAVHLPPGSAVHLPPGSAVHSPPGSIIHPPAASGIHLPAASGVHSPPGSVVHSPPGSVIHPPAASGVHLPGPSAGPIVHQPALSAAAGPAVHVPPGSVHVPAGSGQVHVPAGSVHVPAGSGAVHVPAGSVHTPPGSAQVHMPPGSAQIHSPPGSGNAHAPIISGGTNLRQNPVRPPGQQFRVPQGDIRMQQGRGQQRGPVP